MSLRSQLILLLSLHLPFLYYSSGWLIWFSSIELLWIFHTAKTLFHVRGSARQTYYNNYGRLSGLVINLSVLRTTYTKNCTCRITNCELTTARDQSSLFSNVKSCIIAFIYRTIIFLLVFLSWPVCFSLVYCIIVFCSQLILCPACTCVYLLYLIPYRFSVWYIYLVI